MPRALTAESGRGVTFGLSALDRDVRGTAYGDVFIRLDNTLALLLDDAIDAPPVLDGRGNCRTFGI